MYELILYITLRLQARETVLHAPGPFARAISVQAAERLTSEPCDGTLKAALSVYLNISSRKPK